MKKVILTMLVASSLVVTSCKKAKEEASKKTEVATETVKEKVEEVVTETVIATKEVVQSALEGVSIPEFKDPKVREHLKSYAEYAKDYIEAKGDVLKNTNLAKKGVELAAEGEKVIGSLDEEGAKKFNNVMNTIKSKMAPAN